MAGHGAVEEASVSRRWRSKRSDHETAQRTDVQQSTPQAPDEMMTASSEKPENGTDWIERQLAEVESLRAVFFEDGAVRADEAILQALSERLQSGSKGGGGNLPSPLSLSVRLDSGDGCALGSGLRLALVLPHGYPQDAGEGPIFWLEVDDSVETQPVASSLLVDGDVSTQLQVFARDMGHSGEECLLALAQHASDLLQERISASAASAVEIPGGGEEDELLAHALLQDDLDNMESFDDAVADSTLDVDDWQLAAHAAGPPVLGRRGMYSHHIIAESKRRAIAEWAVQLQLSGLAKIGWPGLIIVEGDERNVRTYVEALSRLRWKHFVVRGEQTVEGRLGQNVDDLRALPRGFEEFGTDGMSEFAARCRQYGMEDLFLACMKMNSAQGGKSKRGSEVDRNEGAGTPGSAAGARRGRKR